MVCGGEHLRELVSWTRDDGIHGSCEQVIAARKHHDTSLCQINLLLKEDIVLDLLTLNDIHFPFTLQSRPKRIVVFELLNDTVQSYRFARKDFT